jgi:hypothetical protein
MYSYIYILLIYVLYMIGKFMPSNQPQMGHELVIFGWLIPIHYVNLFSYSPSNNWGVLYVQPYYTMLIYMFIV